MEMANYSCTHGESHNVVMPDGHHIEIAYWIITTVLTPQKNIFNIT